MRKGFLSFILLASIGCGTAPKEKVATMPGDIYNLNFLFGRKHAPINIPVKDGYIQLKNVYIEADIKYCDQIPANEHGGECVKSE